MSFLDYLISTVCVYIVLNDVNDRQQGVWTLCRRKHLNCHRDTSAPLGLDVSGSPAQEGSLAREAGPCCGVQRPAGYCVRHRWAESRGLSLSPGLQYREQRRRPRRVGGWAPMNQQQRRRARSGAEAGGTEGTAPLRFSNHRLATTRVSGQN